MATIWDVYYNGLSLEEIKKINPVAWGTWLNDGANLSELRMGHITNLFNAKDNVPASRIRDSGRNEGRYAAFRAIVHGFAYHDGEGGLIKAGGENANVSQGQESTDIPIINLLGEGGTAAKFSAIHNKVLRPGNYSTSNVRAIDRADLVSSLRSFQAAPIIDRYKRIELIGKSLRDIVDFSMGSNIYRVFHHETPLQRYRNWRWYRETSKLLDQLNAVGSQEDFDRFALYVGQSLVEDWGPQNNRGEPSKMNIGIAMKITNLILKHLSFSEHCHNSNLIEWLHVPWDKYTLKPLRPIWKEVPPIPNSPSQGFVRDIIMYDKLHFLISGIAQEAELPRIYYEFWAWDAAHQG